MNQPDLESMADETVDLRPGMVRELPLDVITDQHKRRPIREWYVNELVESFREHDVQPRAMKVTPDGTLFAGNHRYEAAKRLGLDSFLRKVEQPDNLDEAARKDNEADGVSLPETFVDRAERIWSQLEGQTQAEVAEAEGCSRGAVGQYARLESISSEAWSEVVTTTNQELRETLEGAVTENVTTVTFTFSQGLLRNIVNLPDSDQLELVTRLADGEIGKGKFKRLAERYEARQEARTHVEDQLDGVQDELREDALSQVDRGIYDDEWIEHDGPGPKLEGLIEQKLDEWRERESITLHHGDIYDVADDVPTDGVDLVVTDPPYNISWDRTFEFEGRGDISHNFGEWDSHDKGDFIEMCASWARLFDRVLTEDGSGYVFTADMYLSYLQDVLEDVGFRVRSTIVWHKTNPGTQVVKTNYKPSVEYIVYFDREDGDTTFNFPGQADAHNFIETPICGGNERLTDADGDTLHPTQKPEELLRQLVAVSSHPGDVVFDPFMGVGSTGAVARDTDRKFIGVERDDSYFEAAERRVLS